MTPTEPAAPAEVDAFGLTETGKVRSENQDRAGTWADSAPEVVREQGRLFVVCDGMGGHASGEEPFFHGLQFFQDFFHREDRFPPGYPRQGHLQDEPGKGGPGRSTKAKEEKYRAVFAETITEDKFKACCLQIFMDAIGKKLDQDGKMIVDSSSTPSTRVNAFTRIAAYALGRPIQPILVDSAEGDILAIFREMPNDKLDEIIAEARRILEKNSANARHD